MPVISLVTLFTFIRYPLKTYTRGRSQSWRCKRMSSVPSAMAAEERKVPSKNVPAVTARE